MTYLIIGIILFLGFTLAGRLQADKGQKLLTQEQRSDLVAGLAATRKWTLLALAGIIMGFLLLIYNFRVNPMAGLYGYFGAFLGYTILAQALSHNVIVKLALPAEYRKLNWRSNIFRFLGLALLLVCMVLFFRENQHMLQNAF